MEISVIASGSNGNCTLVEHKGTSILIDAGKSGKEIKSRMLNLNKELEDVDAIVLTHSHIDHCAGIGPLSRRYSLPVFMTKEVHELSASKLGSIKFNYFSPNEKFRIKNIYINPIETSHDVPSCGFVIENFGIFTDTGIVTKQMEHIIPKLEGIVLESNHDIDMLLNGPYPAYLKQRILSDNGHLSNIHASQLIQDKGKNLKWALLGHLSENNNTPKKAKETFETIVKSKMDYQVLSRDKESGSWKI